MCLITANFSINTNEKSFILFAKKLNKIVKFSQSEYLKKSQKLIEIFA